jgi:hypothetical protein
MDIKKAKQLRQIYYDKYKPPPVFDMSLQCHETEVYYDKGADLEDIITLATEREPVNIAMERYYDKSKLQKQFGWSEGFYGTLMLKYGIAPNIAIYAKTPVFNGKYKRIVDCDIGVINLIGVALDDMRQPDAKYFFKAARSNIKVLVDLYIKVWNKAFYCARHKGYKKIRPAKVGGSAFSSLLSAIKGFNFDTDVYQYSLYMVSENYPDIEVVEQYYPDFIFPDSLTKMSHAELSETLFVNAWDPWSVVGNGNKGDNSLDGFYGRSTALWLLCTPFINPYISYTECSSDGFDIIICDNMLYLSTKQNVFKINLDDVVSISPDTLETEYIKISLVKKIHYKLRYELQANFSSVAGYITIGIMKYKILCQLFDRIYQNF